MPRPALLLPVILLVATGLPIAHAVPAQGQTVHRCIGEHGEISFSDTPCAGAAAVAPTRASASTPLTLAGDRAVAAPTCPVSGDALRDVVAMAFAQRNPNALAGVMRWDGVGSAAARSRMRELAELTQRPLIGIEIEDAVPTSERPAPVGDDGDAGGPRESNASASRRSDAMLTIRTGSLEGGAGEHEFRLVPSRGCYWLDW